jgi:hypothetical protein
MDYLDDDNEVPNPGALPDPTYNGTRTPPGSSIEPEGAAAVSGRAIAEGAAAAALDIVKKAREQ